MSHKKEQAIFNFIVYFKLIHDGNSPTIRLIQEGVGISSTSMVNYYLDELETQGRIRRPRERAAAIEVVGGKWVFEGA